MDLRPEALALGFAVDAEHREDGSAHVGKRRACSDVFPARDRLPVHEDGHIFAGMVGAFEAGIVAVVGGDHQHVVGTQGRQNFGKALVKFLEAFSVAGQVAAVPEMHVKIDQVGEYQPFEVEFHPFQRIVDAFLVVVAFFVGGEATAVENVVDLADAIDLFACIEEVVEHGIGRRINAEVVAVGCAFEFAGDAYEGSCDHAADGPIALQQFAGDFADFVLTLNGNDRFVHGDLEDAVAARVHDRVAGAHVFFAQFVDDHGARCRIISEGAGADQRFESVHDFPWKTLREVRKDHIRDESCDFPMAGDRVFATALFGSAPKGARRRIGTFQPDAGQISEAKRLEMGQGEAGKPRCDMPQGMAAFVAKLRSIREFADSNAVQNNEYYPPDHVYFPIFWCGAGSYEVLGR